VMDFFGSGDGCDGCDGLSIKSPQLNDDDVAPQHHKNPYTECAGKPPPIRHKPPKSSPEPVPAVTSPSQVRHSPSHPSLEPLSAAAKPATIAQNPKSDESDELKVGDRVEYIGENPSLHKQYAGVLKVHEVSNDGYACLKPDGGVTSWIEAADLRLVGD
jgi:hypothetical protein